MVHHHMMGDPEQPGLEPGPFTQAGNSAQDPDPDLLRQIVSGLDARHPAQMGQQGRPPAPDQLLKSRPFAQLAADHQQFLAQPVFRSGVHPRLPISHL
ncbi:hypothetical protein D3C83_66700 [compost metagenome]